MDPLQSRGSFQETEILAEFSRGASLLPSLEDSGILITSKSLQTPFGTRGQPQMKD
jgi:hypothetical protein